MISTLFIRLFRCRKCRTHPNHYYKKRTIKWRTDECGMNKKCCSFNWNNFNSFANPGWFTVNKCFYESFKYNHRKYIYQFFIVTSVFSYSRNMIEYKLIRFIRLLIKVIEYFFECVRHWLLCFLEYFRHWLRFLNISQTKIQPF